jgi:hypothetical protein
VLRVTVDAIIVFNCSHVQFIIKLDGLANVQLRPGWQRFSDRASGKAARHGSGSCRRCLLLRLRARRPSLAGWLPSPRVRRRYPPPLLARSPGWHTHRNERISAPHAFFPDGRTGLTPIRVTSPWTVSRDQIPCRAGPPGPRVMSRAVVLPVDCVILHYTVDLFGIVGVVTNAAAWAGDAAGSIFRAARGRFFTLLPVLVIIQVGGGGDRKSS